MDDLISRAALLKECAECQKTDPRFEERGWANHFINDAGEPSTEWYCVEDMIENAPAVAAAPVVHGRWVEDSDGLPVCSVCDEVAMQKLYCDTLHETWRYDVRLVKTPYCPHCGARMGGEQHLAFADKSGAEYADNPTV